MSHVEVSKFNTLPRPNKLAFLSGNPYNEWYFDIPQEVITIGIFLTTHSRCLLAQRRNSKKHKRSMPPIIWALAQTLFEEMSISPKSMNVPGGGWTYDQL